MAKRKYNAPSEPQVDSGPEQEDERTSDVVESKPSSRMVYSVRAKRPVFWRAGRKFTPTPTMIAENEISPTDLERLMAESNLHVELVEIEG